MALLGLVNLLMVNHECFSLVDLLHRLHCSVITMSMSYQQINMDGWKSITLSYFESNDAMKVVEITTVGLPVLFPF